MNFEFSDELLGLQREVRKMLERESPTALVRAMADGGGDPAPVWNHLVDMGVTGMTLPETCGGNGLGAEALCLVAEEVGRQLSPVPLVSTMYLAAQVLLLGATSGQQQKAVKGIAEGLPWAFAAPLDGEFDVAALPRFDGRVVTGRIPLAADGMAAKGAVILAVDTNTQALCWLLADLDTASVERQQLATLDPGRPFAALCFNATAAEPLGAAGDAAMLLQRVLDRAAVWLAFEQLGGAEAALDAAVEYAKQRIAFGRLIGSYQAIKHKLADLYVSISAARVHCYYGAWALNADLGSCDRHPRLAAAAAAARAVAGATFSRVAQESLQVHGGAGYTWEMDCHLYYRRARMLAAILGHNVRWRERLVAAISTAEDADSSHAGTIEAGALNFDDTPQEAGYRAQCRGWLEAHAQRKQRLGEDWGEGLGSDARMATARQWQAEKAAAGYGAITWPKALGGSGGTVLQELIWREEENHFRVPTGYFNVSLGMVLPSLIANAEPAVLARHTAPALHGETLWCQLLSEPDAGSDLGMLRTRATRVADSRNGWIIKGHKTWTTLAQYADYGLLLARSDPDQPKFAGLTTFIVPMNAPGVTVRPIRQASGDSEFNEVFLDDVFIPDEDRVGAVGAGWKTTLTGLMNERLSVGGVVPPGLWHGLLDQLRVTRFNGRPALEDGRFRDRLADLYLDGQTLWLLQCRALTALAQGSQPGPELSGAKLIAAHTLQSFSALAIDLDAAAGLPVPQAGDAYRSLVRRLWFGAAAMRIAGGTDEIVKNSIGERVLRLPPEPGQDRKASFATLLQQRRSLSERSQV